jgi:hypothetical protein
MTTCGAIGIAPRAVSVLQHIIGHPLHLIVTGGQIGDIEQILPALEDGSAPRTIEGTRCRQLLSPIVSTRVSCGTRRDVTRGASSSEPFGRGSRHRPGPTLRLILGNGTPFQLQFKLGGRLRRIACCASG